MNTSTTHCPKCGRFLELDPSKHVCGFQTGPRAKRAQQNTLFHTMAKEIADLVVSKQSAYGDSFVKSQHIMAILYPNGIKPEQMGDMLTLIRVIDKLFRIATKKDAYGENPWKDILGYALLAVTQDHKSNIYVNTVRNDIDEVKQTIRQQLQELYASDHSYTKIFKMGSDFASRMHFKTRSHKTHTKPLLKRKKASQ